MKYYYVATVRGDVWFASSSLDRVKESILKGEKELPLYFKRNKVQIICYEERNIIEWNAKNM